MTTAFPTDERPASPVMLACAREAIAAFPWCFWFRGTGAAVETVADVQLVVRRLRQHGDRRAWDAAYRIEQCR